MGSERTECNPVLLALPESENNIQESRSNFGQAAHCRMKTLHSNRIEAGPRYDALMESRDHNPPMARHAWVSEEILETETSARNHSEEFTPEVTDI